jgi:hypothetical protein
MGTSHQIDRSPPVMTLVLLHPIPFNPGRIVHAPGLTFASARQPLDRVTVARFDPSIPGAALQEPAGLLAAKAPGPLCATARKPHQ